MPSQPLYQPLRSRFVADLRGWFEGSSLLLPAPPGCEAPPNLVRKGSEVKMKWGTVISRGRDIHVNTMF